MKLAAMPAAERPNVMQTTTDKHERLKLVQKGEDKPASFRSGTQPKDPPVAEDFDEMWDNLPV